MDATTWVFLFQSISVRLMLLFFLGALLYSLWANHAQPFLQNQQAEQDQALKKLADSNTHLHSQIIQQEEENTAKKSHLMAIKQMFLLWHQQRVAASTAACISTELDLIKYKEKMEQKERHILQQQQKSAELSLIIHQLHSNVQKAYQGDAGAIRLKKILEDLERKGS